MAEAVFRSLTYNLPPTPPSRPSLLLPPTTQPPHPLISRIDSAGTGAYHTGSPPDPRTLSILSSRCIENYTHAARKITLQDFQEFDYILAMDRKNLAYLKGIKSRIEKKAGKKVKADIRLFGEFGGEATTKEQDRSEEEGELGGFVGEEVVDPYYGADDGFEVCFEQMERFSKAFLREVVEQGKGQEIEENEVHGERS